MELPRVRREAIAQQLAASLVALTFAAGCDSIDPVRLEVVTATADFADQVVPPGGIADVPPSIRIVDKSGRGIGGMEVAFIPTNGTVSGSPTTTDADGFARAGGWQLDNTEGVQTVTAVIGRFSAPLTATVVSCPTGGLFAEEISIAATSGTAYRPGTIRTGIISDSDCLDDFDFYDRFVFPSDTGSRIFRLSLDSPDFVFGAARTRVAPSWPTFRPGVPLNFIIGRGAIAYGVISGNFGPYTLTSTLNPSNAQLEGCSFEVFGDINVSQRLDDDCTFLDYFLGRSPSQSQLTIEMSSSAFEPQVFAFDCETFDFLGQSESQVSPARLTLNFTSSSVRCLLINATSRDGFSKGAFALRIER